MTEPLLVVEDGGEVGDEHDEGGGDVDGHEGPDDFPFELDLHTDALLPVNECLGGDDGLCKDVLLRLSVAQPGYGAGVNQLEKVLILDGDVHVAGLTAGKYHE